MPPSVTPFALSATVRSGAPRDVWQLEAAPGEEDLGASFPEERTAKFERQRSPHSRLWAFSEDPRDSEGDASSSSEGRRQRVSQHSQVTSREDLLKKAATAHSQSLEELLDRGMSLGAMAKVAAESERKSVYEEITRYAKRAAEVCALDETAQECLEAREEAKDHSLLKMRRWMRDAVWPLRPGTSRPSVRPCRVAGLSVVVVCLCFSLAAETRIGVYSEEKAKDAAGEETGEETGVAGGPLPSSRSPTTSVDALNAKAFVQVGSIGAIWDTLFGGAGAGNAENFEGGNQGSYFNFMYPSDNDFPWACLCDESQYKQWELGQVTLARQHKLKGACCCAGVSTGGGL